MSMTADLDETLLIGSSSFPYFMLVAVEVIPLETTTPQSLHCSPDKKVASPHQSLLSRLFVSRETSFLIGNPEKMEKVKKGAGGRKVGGPKKKPVSQSKGRYSQHVGTGAPVYLAAVLEYLAAEQLRNPSDTPKKRSMSKSSKMLQYINYRMRVTIQDGRQLVGKFMAFDRHMNLVLGDCEEFLQLSPAKKTTEDRDDSRTLGLSPHCPPHPSTARFGWPGSGDDATADLPPAYAADVCAADDLPGAGLGAGDSAAQADAWVSAAADREGATDVAAVCTKAGFCAVPDVAIAAVCAETDCSAATDDERTTSYTEAADAGRTATAEARDAASAECCSCVWPASPWDAASAKPLATAAALIWNAQNWHLELSYSDHSCIFQN
ncbi:unnamed protein product [Camellia sinensis]